MPTSVSVNGVHIPVDVFGVGSARRPDGPPQNGVAHGFSLIPVSGVGVVVDGEKTKRGRRNIQQRHDQ